MECVGSLICCMACLVLLLVGSTLATSCDAKGVYCEKGYDDSERNEPMRKIISSIQSIIKSSFVDVDVQIDRKMNFLLMGKTGNGKSSTGNSIIGWKVFKSSSNTKSQTKEVKAAYAYFGRYRLKVVDGPGLEDTDMDKIRGIETAAENMEKALMLCSEGVDAFLYVMSFGNRFTAEERSALESLKRIFGEKYFNHVIVIVTKGDLFQQSMEEEENIITFEEWCRKQEGEFRDFYEDCNGRFVLFNNWEKDEEKKKAQVQKLVEFAQKLNFRHGRYNYVTFEKAKAEREKLILEMKAPQLTEEIQEKIGLLIGEINKYSKSPSSEGKWILELRIKELENEIKRQDKGYGVLDKLLGRVSSLRDFLDDIEKLKEESRKIENEGNFFYRWTIGLIKKLFRQLI